MGSRRQRHAGSGEHKVREGSYCREGRRGEGGGEVVVRVEEEG